MNMPVLRCTAVAVAAFLISHSCLSHRAHAADVDPPAAVVKLSVPLTIDGNAADWAFDTAEHAVMGLSNPVAAFKLAYDDEALYVFARVQDASPLRNKSAVPEEMFKGGDAIALCFGPAAGKGSVQRLLLSVIDGQTVMLLQRPISAEKHPHKYAADANRAITSDYVAPCPEVKASLQSTTGGYAVEARVPWSVLGFGPAEAQEFPFDLQVEFSDPAGTRNLETRWWHTNGGNPLIVTDLPTESQLYPEFWGRARLTEKDPGPQPTRRNSDDEEGVLSGPGIPIHFTLPRDTKVSLVITDSNGWITRELLRARKFSKGDHTVYWNGRNRTNEPCAPGDYKYRLGYFDGIKSTFYGSVGNSGRPVWKTADGLGSEGGIHGGPSVSAADATGTYLLASLEEGQPQFRKIRPDGTAIWFSTFGCRYTRAAIAVPQAKRLYVAYSGPDQVSTVLGVLDTDTGKPINAFDNQRSNSLELAKVAVEGLVVAGTKAWFSVPTENRIGVIDLVTGKPEADLSMPTPRGMCLLDGSSLLVCSETSVMRVMMNPRQTSPFVSALTAPRAVTVDEKGDVYVSDLGTSQQIKKYSPQGQPLARFGKEGGRRMTVNRYDPLEFQNVQGLAVGADGSLWAVECSPLRRFAKLTTDGKWQEDFYGPISWGAPVIVDLDDPSVVCYENHSIDGSFEFIQTRIDYDAYAKTPGSPVGTWKVERLFKLPSPSAPGSDWYTTGMMFSAHNGKRYLWYYSMRPSQMSGQLFVWENDAWQPVAMLADQRGVGKVWSDTNGDGQQQPEEWAKEPLPSDGWYWIDRDLNAYGIMGRLKPARIDERGVPVYAGGEFTPSLQPGKRTLEAFYKPWIYDWIYPTPPGEDGAQYIVAEYGIGKATHGWDISAESRLIKIANGKVEWIAGHHDGRMLRDGDSDMLNSPAGNVDGVIITSDILDQFVAYSTDGLNLGWVVTDERGLAPDVGPTALYIENALPARFLKDPKTGKHLLFCVSSEDVRVLEVNGVFGNEITRIDGKLTLPSALPRTPQSAGLAQIPYASWEPPSRFGGMTVHGNDWLWPANNPAIAIRDGDALVADVRLRRDAGQLCIFADVLDETPFPAAALKPGEDPGSRYGQSDGVEILLGPGGDDRAVARAGDTRIFLTVQRDKLDNTSIVPPGGIALACRPASPPVAASDQLRALDMAGAFTGNAPAGASDFRDGLRSIPGAVVVVNERLDGHGYRLEAEIPLALFPELTQPSPVYIHRHRGPKGELRVTEQRLDFAPQPLRFNAAVFRDDGAGNAKRFAWVNDGTSNSTDPRAMSPARWGWANSQVDVNWPSILGAVSYNLYRAPMDNPAAATRVAAAVEDTTFVDPRPPAKTVYWLAPLDAQCVEGQWFGPAKSHDGQANFTPGERQPPVSIDQLKTVEAAPGVMRVLNVRADGVTDLSAAAVGKVTVQAIAREHGVWSLITYAPADTPLGDSSHASVKVETKGASPASRSVAIVVVRQIDLMAGLTPGRMESPGHWQFEESGGWKLIDPANATAQLMAESGRPWPALEFKGQVVDTALEYHLPDAQPAKKWSVSGLVRYAPLFTAGGPTNIEVLDDKGAPIARFTHERGGGPWPGHRQFLRLNEFIFYDSDLMTDSLRAAWQPFRITVADGFASLSYAGRTVDKQPTLPGAWERPAVVRIAMKGPNRGIWVGDIQFTAHFETVASK